MAERRAQLLPAAATLRISGLAAAWMLSFGAVAAPQVTAATACVKNAIDIESFATCDGDELAVDRDSLSGPVLLAETRVPTAKRNGLGLYVDAAEAYRLRRDNAASVVLVDIRSRLEAALVGQPSLLDVHVPYLEPATPLVWDRDRGGWRMSPNPAFAAELDQRLQARAVTADHYVILLCRSGERSARASDELALRGYRNVLSVVDGFEGDMSADGRRTLNGWKNAGLPWTSRANAALIYGASSDR